MDCVRCTQGLGGRSINVQKTEMRKRNLIILSVVLILLITAAALWGVLVLHTPQREDTENKPGSGAMAYEANVVTDDVDGLQNAVDQLIEKAREGQMSLQMQTVASSEDGRNFSCHLANSAKNNYDMFMVFYLDDTQQEICRTGLIPVGGRIEKFALEEALEPGTYEATIVYNQVEEDRETIHAQVNVGLLLVVK